MFLRVSSKGGLYWGKEEKVDGNDIFVTRKENETNVDKKASRERRRRRGGLKAPIVL